MKISILFLGSFLCFSFYAAAGFDDFGDRNYGYGPESDLANQCRKTINRVFSNCAGSDKFICAYGLPQECVKMVKRNAALCASGCNLNLLCEVSCLGRATSAFDKEATEDTFKAILHPRY